MGENQNNIPELTTGATARVAAELLALSDKHPVSEEVLLADEPNQHIKALDDFVARYDGKVTPEEMAFLKWNIHEAARQGEDPKAYVEKVIDNVRLNEMHAQSLRNSIGELGRINPEEMRFLEERINEMILNLEDPTEYIHSIAEDLNDTQKLELIDYLTEAMRIATLGYKTAEGGEATELTTAG